MNEKSFFRKKYLDIRNSLSKDEIDKNSNEIKNNLYSLLKFNSSNNILFYVSSKNEVKTHDLIKDTLNRKNVYVPIIEDNPKISKLIDFNDLECCKKNILQPRKDKIQLKHLDNIDLIIVPGIVFDKRGNRIGYGGGYYDKLLEKSNIIKIGLAYSCQIIDMIKTESHDIPVDIIITEKEIIRCKY